MDSSFGQNPPEWWQLDVSVQVKLIEIAHEIAKSQGNASVTMSHMDLEVYLDTFRTTYPELLSTVLHGSAGSVGAEGRTDQPSPPR